MKTKLMIIGASGHGKVVADIALRMKRWNSIAFLDDNVNIQSCLGLNVIGKSSDAVVHLNDSDIFVAIGNNAIRERVQSELEAEGASIPVLIHPSSIIGEMVELEQGTVVMAGAVINSGSRIGKGCIINTSATVDHDNTIGNYVHVSPGVHLAGTVNVGHGTWLGIGSVVSNNVNIVSNCVIGAGSVVIRDITQTGTYVGVPVRRVNR